MLNIFEITKSTMQGISKREKIFLAIGLSSFIFIIVHFIIISPLLENLKFNERVVSSSQKNLREMTILAKKYKELAFEVSEVEKKLGKNFSLLSYIEEKTRKIGISKKITYMRPKGDQVLDDYIISSIELRLKAISLKQAMELVYLIENSHNYMRVKMIKMKTRFSNKNILDLSLRVSSYKTK